MLPEVGAKSVHNVAGIETTVHYKAQSPIQPMRGTAKGSCSPASRSLAPLACSPAAASKNSPSRGMSNRKLQQLPDQAPTGAGSVDDKGGGDGGLKAILDRLISEHQAGEAAGLGHMLPWPCMRLEVTCRRLSCVVVCVSRLCEER